MLKKNKIKSIRLIPCILPHYHQVHDIKAKLKQFKTDLHNCVGYIQDPKMLKETIKALYAKHVRDDIVSRHVQHLATEISINTHHLSFRLIHF